MMRIGGIALAIALMIATSACDYDEDSPGARGACATGSGITLGCHTSPIETPADACWRLVDCGVIHIVNDSAFDWAECMSVISGLSDITQDFVFACIGTASCDDLKRGNAPDGNAFPLCLQGR